MTESSAAQPDISTIRARVFGRTDVGRVREHNEDNFIVADLTRKSRTLREDERDQLIGPNGLLMAVCDGMGGAAAGEVASELAINILYEKLADGTTPVDHDDLARRLVRAVEAAGLRIYSEAKLDRHRRGMGTTATAAALLDRWLFFAQVGDSRAYLLRNERLVQVTRDQSLVNQLIEAGQLTEEEAENFEHNNIILQALGTADSVQVDLTFVELRRGDVVMLCSDGLSGMVRLDDLREALQHNPDPVDAYQMLTERANKAGGHDNITCIVARFDTESLPVVGAEEPLPRYTKYQMPEDTTPEPTIGGRRTGIKELKDPKIGSEVKQRLTDHGPSRSKVGQTMMGMRSPLADFDTDPPDSPEHGRRASANAMSDDVVLPVENTPLWVLAAIVLVVFGGIVLAAYFYIFRN